MRESWLLEDRGKRDIHWDLYWGELNAVDTPPASAVGSVNFGGNYGSI